MKDFRPLFIVKFVNLSAFPFYLCDLVTFELLNLRLLFYQLSSIGTCYYNPQPLVFAL